MKRLLKASWLKSLHPKRWKGMKWCWHWPIQGVHSRQTQNLMVLLRYYREFQRCGSCLGICIFSRGFLTLSLLPGCREMSSSALPVLSAWCPCLISGPDEGATMGWDWVTQILSPLSSSRLLQRWKVVNTDDLHTPVFLFFFRQSLTQCWVNHTQFLIDSPMLPLMRFPWASKRLPTIGPESYKGRSSWHETQSMLPAVLFLCLQNWFRATPEAAKSCVFLESFTFC